MRYHGKVLWFKRSKGIGLIETNEIEGTDVLFLSKAEIQDSDTQQAAKDKSFVGTSVTFATAPGNTRGLIATNVCLA